MAVNTGPDADILPKPGPAFPAAPQPTQVQTYQPPANPNTASTAPGVGSAATGGMWWSPLFEHYLGREANASEINQIKSQSWNYDRLYQHLRQQPSWIKGMTIGALEDYHKVAGPSFFKWLGREPSDQDIRELVSGGVKTGDDIEKYLTNRADVIAAHPGAPLGLNDTAWGQHKAAIDSQYQANLGKAATDQEARDAYSQAASPFRRQPAEQFGLGAGVAQKNEVGGGTDLITQSQLATNARSYA